MATVRLLALTLVLGLLVRGLVVGLYAIPSASMLPALGVGDYLLVAKWPYGWSRYNLPGAPPLFQGRLHACLPRRGDVVVFRAPGSDQDYVKRVIALPGERIAMRHGTLILNGRPIPRLRVGDLVVQPGSGVTCPGHAESDGCRFRRYTETLPGGLAYPVLDLAPGPEDDMTERGVPSGHLFLLGDNRDRSGDSRLSIAEGGIGMVPLDRLVGRSLLRIWSADERR